MQFVNIGFGNVVSVAKIVTIVSPDSAPIKRIVQLAKQDQSVVDATYGRKCKSVITTDSGFLVLSALTPETIHSRLEDLEKNG